MLTLIAFIIVFGVLVLVHEFGHFIFAKKSGMKVEEFGFGFPPRIWGVKKGDTIYSINWIPFGGFVRILGEDGQNTGPGSFSHAPFWSKIKVVVAGVVMNFLLAVLLLTIVNFMGLRIGLTSNEANDSSIHNKQVQIIEVVSGSPASEAGLQPLDQIISLKYGNNSVKATDADVISNFVEKHTGDNLTVTIKRGGEEITKTILARANPPAGEGAMGISLALTGTITYPWYESIWRGVYNAVILTANTAIAYFLFFKSIFIHGKLMSGVVGPVGIANLTGQAIRIGINYLLQFVALISINLAILNIIPFPALDGGRALVLIIEKLKGSPVNKKIEGAVNAVGFYLLILLLIYITIKDVGRFF